MNSLKLSRKTLIWGLPFSFVIAAMCSPSPALAGTVNAESCAYGDVAAAIGLASTGDIVKIPPGDCLWAKKLEVTKGITLQGAGVGSTIIRDSVLTGALLRWNCEPNASHRLTGIEFLPGLRIVQETNGIFVFDCTNTGSTKVRIDHNKFQGLKGVILRPNTVVGVVDHNTFITSQSRTAIYIYDPNWNGTNDRWGDTSWAADLTWGSADFLFIEDNTFRGKSCVDGYRGTRAVLRFNTFTDCHITAHGTESSGRNRGSRGLEIYKNSYNNEGGGAERIMSNIRSGSALIWGNVAAGLLGGAAAQMNQYRMINAFEPFGGATGQNGWDINAANGAAYAQLTASNGSSLKVRVNNAGWAVNKWKGYSIRKTSNCLGSCYSVIVSNTYDTITFAPPDGFRAPLSFVSGDSFKIFRVFEVFDGIGRGGGSLVNGGDWETAPTRPNGWNDQKTVPLYEWLNTNDGVDVGLGSFSSCIGTCRENEHFFNHRPAEIFDGETGVGVGPIANRPTTCNKDVWYWATDEGEWDATNPGADGRGYVCVGAAGWNVAYTPYAYPHPMTSETAAATLFVQNHAIKAPTTSVSSPERNSHASIARLDSHLDLALSLRTEPESGDIIIGLKKNGMLTTEAIAPATAPIQGGNMIVRNSGATSSSIVLTNPGLEDAVISFRFANAPGLDVAAGSLILEAGGRLASFLHHAPFNGPTVIDGSFTFTSSVPVIALGLRSLGNEDGEFLLAAWPVAPLDPEQRGHGLPLFADGGGWRTELNLTNPSEVTVTGTVRFVRQDIAARDAALLDVPTDGGLGSTFSYVIPPHGLARLVTTGVDPNVLVGSVRIVPAVGSDGITDRPVATALLSLQRAGLTVNQTAVTSTPTQ